MFLALLTAPPANADWQVVKVNNFTQGYADKGRILFLSPSMCVKWKLAGVIHYRGTYVEEHRTTSQGGAIAYGYAIDKVKLTYNSVTIDTFRTDAGKCTSTRKKYSKLRITEKMRGYACDFNPSLSVGLPWSTGASFWPDCGEKNLARWQRTTEDDASHFVLNNSKAEVSYTGKQERGWFASKKTNLTWKCYGADAEVVVQTRNATDTKDTGRIKICPGWTGSTSGW